MICDRRVCAAALLVLSVACGGGGGSTSGSGGNGSGGGGGGGGKNLPPTLAVVTPSQVNTNAAPAINPIVYGSGFTNLSEVEINGTGVTTLFQSSSELWTLTPFGTLATPGVYAITVNGPYGESNALPVTVYTPEQGPQPFIALPGYSPGVENPPSAIATADFNGDGRDDVVINAGTSGLGIAVMLGQANGELGTPQYIGPSPSPGAISLAAGDVNGDGFPDVIAGNYPAVGSNNLNASSFTIWLNDGTGNFTAGQSLTFARTYPGPMILADMLGPGRNDLLVAAEQPNTLYLFPNQGNGPFGPPVTLASLGPDRWFAVTDMNGDGLPSIVYEGVNVSTGNPNTHILLNQGGGVFSDVLPADCQYWRRVCGRGF